MLDNLRDLVSKKLDAKQGADGREHGVRLATAALLVEMVRADAQTLWEEATALHGLLARHFKLAPDEVRALIAAAEREADAAVSLHGFTKLMNETLDATEKAMVLELMWRVALADQKLDRYEEHLVRKVADLLYLPNSELVRTKLKVETALAKP
jgi:uncharacterized tellurite resistance protein B-like protein